MGALRRHAVFGSVVDEFGEYRHWLGADVGGADALLLQGFPQQGFPQGAGHFRWQMGVGPRRGRTPSLDFRAVRGFPTALGETQQAVLKGAVQGLPELSGIEPANWNRKVARQFVSERFGIGLGIVLSRGSCLNYLHCLGFVLKRPKKRLVKADEAKREAFVAEYATRRDGVHRSGAGYSSPARPTAGRTRSCGANGH